MMEFTVRLNLNMASGAVKKIQRKISVSCSNGTYYSGNITKAGKITASWCWDVDKYYVPVIYSNVTGKVIKGSQMDPKIKEVIEKYNDEIDKQAEEAAVKASESKS